MQNKNSTCLYCGLLDLRTRERSTQKSIGIFNADKTEEKYAIQDLNQIFGLADKLKLMVKIYEDPASKKVLATVGERAS